MKPEKACRQQAPPENKSAVLRLLLITNVIFSCLIFYIMIRLREIGVILGQHSEIIVQFHNNMILQNENIQGIIDALQSVDDILNRIITFLSN